MIVFNFAAHWSLKRWLLGSLGLLGIVLLTLAAAIAATYVLERDSRAAAALAMRTQTDLQMYLRGLNEAVLSDGSSSATKLARDSRQQLAAGLKALLAVGTLIYRVVFARLGGEPSLACGPCDATEGGAGGEQSAAAAESSKQQALQLVQAVSVFRLGRPAAA